MKKTISFIALLLLVSSALATGYRFPVGEETVYKIMWGPITCGRVQINCEQVQYDQQNLVRIRVRVKSNAVVSTLYPVDDTVDCYIDPKTMLSVRLEKNTSEGDVLCQDVLQIDRTRNRAQWDSQSDNLSTNYPIENGACDAVSFLYALRQFNFNEVPQHDFKMVVDTALHEVTITAGKTDTKKIGDSGKVLCRKFTASPKRDDLFVRKIPKDIWITEDDRRIMALMTVKTPVGKARLVLDEYRPAK